MLSGQVPELVRQQGLELLGRQCLHLREAEEQVVAVPAERPEAGNLSQRGVAVLGQQHAVQAWSVELAREPVDQREELGCIGRPDAHAFGALDAHSERAEDQTEKEYEGRREGQDAIGRSVELQRPHQQGDRASEPDEDQQHVAVSREGEYGHLPRVALPVALRMSLALADERFELLRRHRHAGGAAIRARPRGADGSRASPPAPRLPCRRPRADSRRSRAPNFILNSRRATPGPACSLIPSRSWIQPARTRSVSTSSRASSSGFFLVGGTGSQPRE